MSEQSNPTTVYQALAEILPGVQGPARYLGLERNLVRKGWDEAAVRVALAFPDAYAIGMSHFGSQVLYHLVNRRADALAERCYVPMPDMAAALRSRGIPLYTLESYRPVASFDVVGISLQSELNYSNVPFLLDLAGIPRRAVERGRGDPLVLGGGPCTANPEPVADLFDAFLLGDAEAGLDAILDTVRDARREGAERLDLLRRLATLPGVYVPRFYRWRPDAGWEVLEPGAPLPVRRVWAPRLERADQPERPLLPVVEVAQDRVGLEIARGCTHGCRFCQAGFWYRPVREHDPAALLEQFQRQVEASGLEEVGLLSLSTADYSQIRPLASTLAERLAGQRVSISLPSLRADSFSVELADAVARVRKSGFTFAPETGSDRLRAVVNKSMTNQDLLDAAETAFERGWNLIKLYAMVGLPTETEDDLEQLVELTAELAAVGRRLRGNRAEVKLSVAAFVPKPWTPFQWQPMLPVAELVQRMQLLRDRCHRLRGVRTHWNDPNHSALEAVLARGDRRLGATVERAHDLGAMLDGWSDHLDLAAWQRAFAETGVDLARELGPRPLDAPLPWDHIDAGVRKSFLAAEARRALDGHTTPDCRGGTCLGCGIEGDGADLRLASADLPHPAPASGPAVGATRQAAVFRRYRITFSKRGDVRFLSHRQTMTVLERALRAAQVPVHFTEGFNPHIRLSMGPALALGHEGLAELLDLDCVAPLRPQHLEAASRALPEGLALLDARELLTGAPSLGKLMASARYRLDAGEGRAWPTADALPAEVASGVLGWSALDDGSLRVELNLRHDVGPTPTVKELLAALGFSSEAALRVRVTRELLLLAPGTRQ